MALDIHVDQEADQSVIVVSGEVDLNTSPDLRSALLEAVKDEHGVKVDLAAVDYMDSSGVATLVEAFKACLAGNQAFQLLFPSEAVMRVLRLARLDTLFDIQEREEAD